MTHGINYYIGYVVAVVAAIPGGAFLVRHLTSWVAGFKPRYRVALFSVVIAYAAIVGIGFAIRLSGVIIDRKSAGGLGLLIGLGALASCHVTFIKSEAGVGISPGKAIVITCGQIFGVIVLTLLLLLPIGLLWRVFKW